MGDGRNDGERDDDEISMYPLLIGGRGDEDGYVTNSAYQVLVNEPTWDVFGDATYGVGKWQAQAEACFVALVGRVWYQGTAGTDSISISFTRQFQVLTKKIQITLFMHCAHIM